MAVRWLRRLFKDGEGSIFLLSNEGSVVHRRRVSKSLVCLVLGLFVFSTIMFLSGLIGFFHYKSLYEETEKANTNLADFMRERDQLLKKVEKMGEVVTRTERFLASSKRSFNIEDGEKAQTEGSWAFSMDSSDLEMTKLDLLLAESQKVENVAHGLFAHSQDLLFYWAARPRVWPTQGYVTSEFGAWRRWGGGSGWRRHEGIDVAANTGTPIKSVADGLVTYSGYSGGYGKTIKISHGYGLVTTYSHCSRLNVLEGERVKGGQLIAAVGNTGYSTGPHLHFEVQVDGIPVNPLRYLPSL